MFSSFSNSNTALLCVKLSLYVLHTTEYFIFNFETQVKEILILWWRPLCGEDQVQFWAHVQLRAWPAQQPSRHPCRTEKINLRLGTDDTETERSLTLDGLQLPRQFRLGIKILVVLNMLLYGYQACAEWCTECSFFHLNFDTDSKIIM